MKTEPTDEMKEKKYQWEPSWYADIDYSAEDTDYLREQGCCSVCGAYIADLPGYYWIESDYCPNCACDRTEKWSDRINKNKIGYTRVYCECGKAFNLFVDTFGIYHGVMTFKQIIEKYKQKQVLINTMRGDEQIGLYDDNPKNHGYER